jgi:glycosyltransferase involved in cell wall biosynthesis
MRAAESVELPQASAHNCGVRPEIRKPRIRILHSVGHLLRGGIETWLYQTLPRLNANRFEHHVLVRTEKEEPFTEAFRRAGIRVVPCLNYGNPVKYASNLRRVVAQNGPYDILHVHGSNPNGLLALLFAKALGISNRIVHSHNDVRPLLKSRGILYKSYVGLTLQGLRFIPDCGFAVSTLAAESMFGRFWQKDPRWKLLYCGVNFEPFAEPPDPNLRKRLHIPEDAFVVGHVGRFHEQKNHEFLVKIAHEAVTRRPNTHFLLIGDGPLRNSIAAEFERRGLSHNVTFIPDTLEVPRIMLSAMDCFVLPSRYEGLVLVSVEAQAAGLPCFLSDCITKEAIVDTKLVKMLRLEDSAESWANAIQNSRKQRVRGPQHLKQFYASQFNLEKCAASISSTYESLVTRHAN